MDPVVESEAECVAGQPVVPCLIKEPEAVGESQCHRIDDQDEMIPLPSLMYEGKVIPKLIMYDGIAKNDSIAK